MSGRWLDEGLPFALTDGQRTTIAEIDADLEKQVAKILDLLNEVAK